MFNNDSRFFSLALVLLIGLAPAANATDRSIILQSTTSTANSGLYKFLLPKFEKMTGIKVRVVAVGTGQALRNGRAGDGDVLLVHAKPAEEEFVNQGYGVKRFDVMFNDFIIVGPKADPAGIRGGTNAASAFAKIAESKAFFASRGDSSGTHKKELQLWQSANMDPTPDSGKWYRETGSGMGATLNIAVGMGAYAITDRGTWISFKNKRGFEVLLEGDKALFNQYGIILINPARHKNVNQRDGQAFIDWILSQEGQSAIAAYKLNGKQLFFPNAR